MNEQTARAAQLGVELDEVHAAVGGGVAQGEPLQAELNELREKLATVTRVEAGQRGKDEIMTTLLHVSASARTGRSLTRALARRFLDEWLARRPGDTELHRDLGTDPPPAVSEATIGAFFTPKAERTPEQHELCRLSDTLIDEVTAADVIVLATPMYNYGMPAALKAWFDQVIRIDRTFSFDLARGDYPLEPVLSGKTLVLLTSSGEFGFAPGGPRAAMNHLVPHIRTCAKYLGVARDYHVGIEYQEFRDARHERSVRGAHAAVPRLVADLVREANEPRAAP